MSLDVYLVSEPCSHCGSNGRDIFCANIAHNLNTMAEAAGIYREVWRPEEVEIFRAKQMIEPLKKGIAWLKANGIEASKHNAPNGWGKYEDFVPWLEKYLQACEANPEAKVSVSR